MWGPITVYELIGEAIAMEEEAALLYTTLAGSFREYEVVSGIFNDLAHDELEHKKELTNIRNTLDENILNEPADTRIVEDLSKYNHLDHEKAQKLRDLDEAYELCHVFESSEINTIYRALSAKYCADELKRQLILKTLNHHIGKLTMIKDMYPTSKERKRIKPAVSL